MTTLCEYDRDTSIIYQDYVGPITYIVMALTMIPLFYHYIAAYYKGNLQSSKSSVYAGAIFFTLIFMYYIATAALSVNKCHNSEMYWILFAVGDCLYLCQSIMLEICLFIRLVFIFKSTDFEISKPMIRFFAALSITGFIVAISGMILFVFVTSLSTTGKFMMASYFIFYILTVIWLNMICIYKVNSSHEDN